MPHWANGTQFGRRGEGRREGERQRIHYTVYPYNPSIFCSLLWGIPRQLQLQLYLQLELQLQLLSVISGCRTNVTHRADQMKLLVATTLKLKAKFKPFPAFP